MAVARPVSLPQTPPPTSNAVPTAPVQAVAVASSSSPPGSPPRSGSGSGSGRRLLLQDRTSDWGDASVDDIEEEKQELVRTVMLRGKKYG